MKHFLSIVITVVLIAAGSVTAALITDYFEYGDSYQGNLPGLTTANTVGWAANTWTHSGGSVPQYTNLPTGFASAYGPVNSYVSTNLGGCAMGFTDGTVSVMSRAFAEALTGTVWISMVVTNSRWQAVYDLLNCRVQINNMATNYFGVFTGGNASLGGVWVTENGVMTTNYFALGTSSGQAGCLLVARLRTDFSNTADHITVWAFGNNTPLLNGRTVAALGAPVYQSPDPQDLWGDQITSLGLYLRRHNTAGRELVVDELRISHGEMSDDNHVFEIMTGVPEPAVIGLAALALVAVRRK